MRTLDKLLKAWTGFDANTWMLGIEKVISEDSIPGKNGKLGTMKKGSNWLAVVSEMVYKAVARRPSGDHNIASAMCLSLICSLWFSRITRAKCHDPRRKVKDRQKFMRAVYKYQHALLEAVHDASRDHLYFKDHDWDPPFSSKGGKDGTRGTAKPTSQNRRRAQPANASNPARARKKG